MQALQDVETAAAAVALQRIGGVGHQLQFAKHELGNDNGAVEKAGFGDISDAAVNDDAGIENLVALLRLLLAAKDSPQRRKIEQIAFVGADDQANVGHQQHDHDLEETSRVARAEAVAEDQGKQVGAEDAQHAADGGPDQPLQADPAQPPFEQDDG